MLKETESKSTRLCPHRQKTLNRVRIVHSSSTLTNCTIVLVLEAMLAEVVVIVVVLVVLVSALTYFITVPPILCNLERNNSEPDTLW